MNQKHAYASGLLALGISVALQTTALAGADAPSASLLMNEAEIAAHKSTMATLEGRARDEYRDAQYERLKRRAQEQGFSLPEQPPWANAAAIPAEAVAPAAPAKTASATPTMDDKAAAEAMARHDAMREKLQAQQLPQKQVAPVRPEPSQTAAEAPAPVAGTPQPRTGSDLPVVPAPAQTAVVVKPTPSAPAMAQIPAAPTPAVRPTPPAPPTPPALPTTAGMSESRTGPRFAPVEMAPPAPVAPVTSQPMVATPESDAEQPATGAAVAGGADAMAAYRENMRTRFDEYMKQREEQMEENARRQREQHQAAMEKQRALRANRAPYPPYPFPAAPPSYGPRYPAAYPGYRTPYWEQQ